MQTFLFGEYLPDVPSHASGALAIAQNAMPIANGYASVGQFAAASNGNLGSACKGGGAYRFGGSTYIFAATATDIFRYQTGGHTSLKTGLSTNIAMTFCPFGRFMLATNGADPIQQFDPSAPTSFADLGGSPPIANYLAVVRGILVAGYAGGSSLRVQWSDTGDPTNWTAGGASLAGQFDMPSGGDITGVVGGEYGLILQERRVVRMSFTGDDQIWQFDEISTNTGCVAPWSVATQGRLTFFLSDKGFMVCDGTTVTPIGDQKVDRTFLSQAQNAFYNDMSAAIDPVNSLYVVTLPSTSPTTLAYVYSYLLGRWTTIATPVEKLIPAFGLNTTLEDLDALYGSLDAMTMSLDSPQFKGGRPVLMLYNDANMLGSLSGPNASAAFVDCRRDLIPGRRVRLQDVKPLTNAASLTVLVYGRNSLSDTDHVSYYTQRTSSGVYRTRDSYNLIQIGVTIPAGQDWSFIQGFDANFALGGRI